MNLSPASNQPHLLELRDPTTALQARGGEIILLTGDSGSGKSLWLQRLAGLSELPEQSSVTLDGADTKRHCVRMLFDRWPCLWLGQHVGEELAFGLDAQPETKQLTEMLAQWRLAGVALDHDPQQLNRLLALRLNLAATALAAPVLTLLDNPTAALSSTDADAVIRDIADWVVRSNTIMVVACNRWHDWRSDASQVWHVSAPDALPRMKDQA